MVWGHFNYCNLSKLAEPHLDSWWFVCYFSIAADIERKTFMPTHIHTCVRRGLRVNYPEDLINLLDISL